MASDSGSRSRIHIVYLGQNVKIFLSEIDVSAQKGPEGVQQCDNFGLEYKASGAVAQTAVTRIFIDGRYETQILGLGLNRAQTQLTMLANDAGSGCNTASRKLESTSLQETIQRIMISEHGLSMEQSFANSRRVAHITNLVPDLLPTVTQDYSSIGYHLINLQWRSRKLLTAKRMKPPAASSGDSRTSCTTNNTGCTADDFPEKDSFPFSLFNQEHLPPDLVGLGTKFSSTRDASEKKHLREAGKVDTISHLKYPFPHVQQHAGRSQCQQSPGGRPQSSGQNKSKLHVWALRDKRNDEEDELDDDDMDCAKEDEEVLQADTITLYNNIHQSIADSQEYQDLIFRLRALSLSEFNIPTSAPPSTILTGTSSTGTSRPSGAASSSTYATTVGSYDEANREQSKKRKGNNDSEESQGKADDDGQSLVKSQSKKPKCVDDPNLPCPFHVHDPIMFSDRVESSSRYKTCSNRFSLIKDLVQHFKEVHFFGNDYCPRCFKKFKDQGAQIAHSRANERCATTPRETIESNKWLVPSLSNGRYERLKAVGKKNRVRSPIEHWKLMYQAIFQNDPTYTQLASRSVGYVNSGLEHTTPLTGHYVPGPQSGALNLSMHSSVPSSHISYHMASLGNNYNRLHPSTAGLQPNTQVGTSSLTAANSPTDTTFGSQSTLHTVTNRDYNRHWTQPSRPPNSHMHAQNALNPYPSGAYQRSSQMASDHNSGQQATSSDLHQRNLYSVPGMTSASPYRACPVTGNAQSSMTHNVSFDTRQNAYPTRTNNAYTPNPLDNTYSDLVGNVQQGYHLNNTYPIQQQNMHYTSSNQPHDPFLDNSEVPPATYPVVFQTSPASTSIDDPFEPNPSFSRWPYNLSQNPYHH